MLPLAAIAAQQWIPAYAGMTTVGVTTVGVTNLTGSFWVLNTMQIRTRPALRYTSRSIQDFFELSILLSSLFAIPSSGVLVLPYFPEIHEIHSKQVCPDYIRQ